MSDPVREVSDPVKAVSDPVREVPDPVGEVGFVVWVGAMLAFVVVVGVVFVALREIVPVVRIGAMPVFVVVVVVVFVESSSSVYVCGLLIDSSETKRCRR